MTRVEARLIAAFIVVLCPLTLFLVGWWTSAALSIYRLLDLSENAIAMTALAGLGLGALLDVLFLKRWMGRAYDLNAVALVFLYVFYSLVTLAFFMGVPVFNLGLGVIAGLYGGRRSLDRGLCREDLAKAGRGISSFTAAVMFLVALVSGTLALSDPRTPANLQGMFGLPPNPIARELTIGLVIIGIPGLTVFQYWLTRTVVRWSFGLGANALRLSGRR